MLSRSLQSNHLASAKPLRLVSVLTAILLLTNTVGTAPSIQAGQAGREIAFPISIKWQQRSGVARYRLQIAADDKFQDIFLDVRVFGNRYVVSELPSGYYYWRVAPADANLGAFSAPVRFFVSGGVVSTVKLPDRAPNKRSKIR